MSEVYRAKRFYQTARDKMDVARELFEEFPENERAARLLMAALDSLHGSVHDYYLKSGRAEQGDSSDNPTRVAMEENTPTSAN